MKYFNQAYKTLKLYGILGHSRKSNLLGVHPLVISILFIIVTESLWSFVRRFVKANFGDGLLRRLVLEFVATAELCATCFELIIVADNYGVWTYALFLFLLTIWWSYVWEEATACPYNTVEEIVQRNENPIKGALIIAAQTLGGLSIFRYIQVLWSLELVQTHQGRAFEECAADLQVSMVVGALIEGMATCLCRVTSKVLGETNSSIANILDALFSTSMVVAAFNYSGGYLNPALATSLKYGCQGNTTVEHAVVYWLGPTIGAVMSIFIFKSQPVQNIVKSLTGKYD